MTEYPATEVASFEPGGYRYIRGPFQYSAGVAAEPGFAIERVRFARPVPLEEGFRRIEAYLNETGRPLTSFCACELRSPAPFTEQGFVDFNRIYVGTLERWGIFENEENPVARSNVCPEINPPSEPSFEAFCHTVPADMGGNGVKSFVIAGTAEASEGKGDYRDRVLRLGETSPEAMTDKAHYVLGALETRLAALGVGWADVTATQIYTVHDIHPFLADEMIRRGAAPGGVTWYYNRPPVVGVDYEMDVRGVPVQRVVSA